MKLAIVTTHPIQYNAPWFKLLAQQPGVQLKVFYTWEESQQTEIYDTGFQKMRGWDIPLLDGYEYVFVKNVSENQNSDHFKGIDNPTLVNDIKDWGAQAVLVIGWPFKSHLAVLQKFKGKIPVLFRGDSTLLREKPGLKKIARRIFLRYIYSHVDYALYVGKHNKDYFTAHGLKENQLVLAPHAIDNDRFSEPNDKYEAEAKEWRRKLGIADSDFVLLFAAKLDANKNPGFVIDIANKISSDRFKFIIVGNGPLEKEMKEKAKHDNRILFVDFQNQQAMPVVYRLGDAYMLASDAETWGLGLNEAMACNRPVIATETVGGAIDLIKGNGLIIKIGDASAVADYIQSLASDKVLYSQVSAHSKENIRNFSFQHIVNSISTLTKKLEDRAAN